MVAHKMHARLLSTALVVLGVPMDIEAMVVPSAQVQWRLSAAASALDPPSIIADVYAIPDEYLERSGNLESFEKYQRMYKQSIDNPRDFWTKVASDFVWRGVPLEAASISHNFDRTKGPISIQWFKGAQTNIAYNALDQQIASGRGDQVAMFAERNSIDETSPFQPETYTYSELCDEVNRLANVLRAQGVRAGDRVVIFMAHTPENCAAMLACARIGAVHRYVL
jgi:acetyl-CoA synthetase